MCTTYLNLCILLSRRLHQFLTRHASDIQLTLQPLNLLLLLQSGDSRLDQEFLGLFPMFLTLLVVALSDLHLVRQILNLPYQCSTLQLVRRGVIGVRVGQAGDLLRQGFVLDLRHGGGLLQQCAFFFHFEVLLGGVVHNVTQTVQS